MEVIERRKDGRLPNEVRATEIKIGVIQGAKGSCMVQKNRTKIISSVQVSSIDESDFEFKCTVSFPRFAPETPQLKRKEIEATEVLEQALKGRVLPENNSGLKIELKSFVLEEDGGVKDSVITSGALALFDADVRIDDIIIASSVVKMNNFKRCLVDPTSQEEDDKVGSVLIASVPSTNSITQIFMSGVLQPNDISECLAVAMDECWKINEIVQKIREQRKQKMEQ
ncbi:hypothetical protein EIN_155690 [Entamoeba invadens IP1]|uniref:Exosome complex exonuclease RRP46 n=1 Tax=Entamoeba invadens IP1 TaxID=370355 RepID=A0A0A1U9D3_ENTIV|nr:hypothetical protein EIN_155690 [Entamoeba invadens IP1]ELP91452.1 hypothetical protein EIN_155690 [Entamoeba invadens IP1]|eukprot:XP_004258223.1 hypothetical protein EIN_155690 [Entamoeba invadens IP1]